MAVVGTLNTSTREVWLEQALQQIPAGNRILDAGAGELKFKKFCGHLDYISQDFAQYDGSGDGKGLQAGSWDQTKLDIVSDITAIPEPDHSFDAIMCVEVFEHLPDPLRALQEFSRLLKPGGQLILTAPFCSLTHLAPYHFYSGFNIYFYETHLKQHGFELIEIQKNGNFFEYLAQEIRRIPSVAIQYANDRPNPQEMLLIKDLLAMLQRFTDQDGGSSELLCFGYHIRAIKR